MRALLSAVTLFTATVWLPPQVPSTPAGAPAPAASTMSTYRSDALHLSYSYPSTYTDASGTVGPAFQASIGNIDTGTKSELLCVTLPFSVMNSGGGSFGMVLLVRASAGCMKKELTAADLPTFTRGEVQGLAASGAHTQFSDPVPFTLQGRPAQLLQGTFELPTGQALHSLAVCTLLKPDIACWQFLASSAASLRTMAAFPVSLGNGPSTPLVQPALLAKP